MATNPAVILALIADFAPVFRDVAEVIDMWKNDEDVDPETLRRLQESGAEVSDRLDALRESMREDPQD